ncbi:MAG: hypothetical protein K0B02_02040 [DPANN group archaeon]|nr:hypothetical protein [DPANN group archaeon]
MPNKNIKILKDENETLKDINSEKLIEQDSKPLTNKQNDENENNNRKDTSQTQNNETETKSNITINTLNSKLVDIENDILNILKEENNVPKPLPKFETQEHFNVISAIEFSIDTSKKIFNQCINTIDQLKTDYKITTKDNKLIEKTAKNEFSKEDTDTITSVLINKDSSDIETKINIEFEKIKIIKKYISELGNIESKIYNEKNNQAKLALTKEFSNINNLFAKIMSIYGYNNDIVPQFKIKQ